jgi:hypothetical protein
MGGGRGAHGSAGAAEEVRCDPCNHFYIMHCMGFSLIFSGVARLFLGAAGMIWEAVTAAAQAGGGGGGGARL